MRYLHEISTYVDLILFKQWCLFSPTYRINYMYHYLMMFILSKLEIKKFMI